MKRFAAKHRDITEKIRVATVFPRIRKDSGVLLHVLGVLRSVRRLNEGQFSVPRGCGYCFSVGTEFIN